eukprot:TRINITY_DN102014_c0_g1_i1.p1 TRINITY_DN102014_c0_g1~~TRINITY_DN102014_c0_g1_i1.p1  ORF type:complete len:808 (-),score=91.68 TRINITY_DN102014_c0_g1_i1:58-2340(-)
MQSNCREKVSTKTIFEIASLSKTFAAALSIEWFHSHGISLDTSVNALLSRTLSHFRVTKSTDKEGESWTGDDVTCAHLMSHHALNMHYVNGVPADRDMPPITAFLNGNEEYGYSPVVALYKPGTVFQYSGGGFIVLEHLLQELSGKSIHELAEPFFKGLGLDSMTFEQWNRTGFDYASGNRDDGSSVAGGRKMFPAFAAGGMSTTKDVVVFLKHLSEAYHHVEGSGSISHDTARLMMHGFDHGCKKFMGCLMGLGLFILNAGDNKFAIHQGANDGFRCIYACCITGPDRGAGFCMSANAELAAVHLISHISQILLQNMAVSGIDFSRFKLSFADENLKQEEVVNRGYRDLIFDAFLPERAPLIERPNGGSRDPLADFNKLLNAKIIYCSNDRFARCENTLSPFEAYFDPALFCNQGKVMDSWESCRHNLKDADGLTCIPLVPFKPRYVSVSTKYHLGNQAVAIRILGYRVAAEARSIGTDESFACSLCAPLPEGVYEILPKTCLEGHSLIQMELDALPDDVLIEAVTLQNIPDGGITRVQLFESLPQSFLEKFAPRDKACSQVWPDAIPTTLKPLVEARCPSALDRERAMAEAMKKIEEQQMVNVADIDLGASIEAVTNEHYSPAIQVISPLPPINMFDGLESARSRVKGSRESVTVKLAWPASITSILCDWTYFVNNNPLYVTIAARRADTHEWVKLIEDDFVKPFAASKKLYSKKTCSKGELQLFGDLQTQFSSVRFEAFPCGGINRLLVFSSSSPQK